MGLFVGLTCSVVKMSGSHVQCRWLATAHTTFIVCFKIHLLLRCAAKVKRTEMCSIVTRVDVAVAALAT